MPDQGTPQAPSSGVTHEHAGSRSACAPGPLGRQAGGLLCFQAGETLLARGAYWYVGRIQYVVGVLRTVLCNPAVWCTAPAAHAWSPVPACAAVRRVNSGRSNVFVLKETVSRFPSKPRPAGPRKGSKPRTSMAAPLRQTPEHGCMSTEGSWNTRPPFDACGAVCQAVRLPPRLNSRSRRQDAAVKRAHARGPDTRYQM